MRLEQITFTRFIAALFVIFFHFAKDIYPFNSESFGFITRQGNLGVSYFFMLSGFVMVIAYGDKVKVNFFDYLKNRLARIYPVYLFALIAYVLIIFFMLKMSTNWIDFSLNFFLLQAWFSERALTLNPPGWSLSAELFFYILFPFFFNFIYKKLNIWKVSIIILGIYVTSQIIFISALNTILTNPDGGNHLNQVLYMPIFHLNEFLLGNLVGLFFIKKLKNKTWNFDIAIIALIIVYVLLLKYNETIINHNGLYAYILLPIILLIVLNKGILTKIMNKKAFVFLGEISYSMYILQIPVFYFVTLKMHQMRFMNEYAIFYISLFFLILSSSLSYRYIETPLRQKIKGIRIKQ